jgi:hypothetical protein
MGVASAISGGLGAATGIYTAISEMGNKKKIAKAIANLPENKLTNIADGMQVSTRGANLQKEEQGRLAATQVGALSEGGSRSLIGGIGQVSASNQAVNEQIGANLDEQQNNITNVRAQDEQRIQMTKEQRANAKLAALSSQYNASSQNMMSGIGNAIGGIGQVGSGMTASGHDSSGNVAARQAARTARVKARN